MFKKFLGFLSCVGVTSIAATSVVSCTAPQFADGVDGQRVVVVTDGGHVNDKAFNQDAYEGTTTFLKQAFNHGSKHSYVVPQDSNYANLISGYKMALIKGANALVLPGFTHASVVAGTESFLQKQNIVLVDCEYDAPNVISIEFNSQLAGFLAGFNTSYWATTKNKDGNLLGDKNGDGHIAIGTFIGSSNKYSTDNYSWGLLLGMATYNEWAKEYSPGRAKVYSANTSSDSSSPGSEEISDVKSSGTSDSDWFSGSFDLGGAIKSGIVSRLIDTKKADIMFPVAGGQVQDVINYKTPTYMIGVDVDQAASYPDAAKEGRYVTSAVKNIHQAVDDALYRAQSKTRKNTLNIKNNPYKNDYWLGTTPQPLEDWSINYTQKDNSSYLLKTDQFNLQDLWNKSNKDDDDISAAQLINNQYETILGPHPQDYLDGNKIVEFSKTLISKYASEFSTVGKK